MPGAILEVEFLHPSVGGREVTYLNPPYRPHFRVGTGDYLGVEFVDGPDAPVSPGTVTPAKVRFAYFPQVHYDDLKMGAQFQILEGARIVGVGIVKELLP